MRLLVLGVCVVAGVFGLGCAACAAPSPQVEASLRQVLANHPYLGEATGPVESIPGGWRLPCERGVVFFDESRPESTSEVHGEILAKYLSVGGPAGALGFPRTSGRIGANGVGSYNDFAHGSIYSFPLLGAFAVRDAIREKWLALGAESGVLGFPKADVGPADRGGASGLFQHGAIYFHPSFGAHPVWGALLQAWTDSGGLAGPYGYPIEDPYSLDGLSYQRFEKGTIALDEKRRDLRSEIARRGIAVRNQGSRGTCSIFAMTFLLDYAYSELLGPAYGDLSEEYLNHAANLATGKTCDGDIFGGAAAGYDTYGIVPEAAWTYDPSASYDSSKTILSKDLYEAAQAMVAQGLRLEGHFVVPLGEPGATDEQFEAIVSYLKRGIPVAIGRGHSMVAVGYREDPSGYLLLRNSYGPTADEAGYRWESFASVKSTVNDAFVYEPPHRPDATFPRELAGHWRLDEASGLTATDASGAMPAGILRGGPVWTTGRSGGGLDLDGKDDFVALGDLDGLPAGHAPRSLCAWAKADTTSPGWRWIVALGTAGQGEAMFLGMNGTSLFGGGYMDDLEVPSFWRAGTWHHVCLTYDGATARLYADGKEVASAQKDWDLVRNRAVIGRQVNDAAEFWNGVVDDVRIYRRALFPSEIKAIMEGKPVPDAAALAALAASQTK